MDSLSNLVIDTLKFDDSVYTAASNDSSGTASLVIIIMIALIAIVGLIVLVKERTQVIDKVVLDSDMLAKNPTHDPSKRSSYLTSLVNNKWFTKRYFKK